LKGLDSKDPTSAHAKGEKKRNLGEVMTTEREAGREVSDRKTAGTPSTTAFSRHERTTRLNMCLKTSNWGERRPRRRGSASRARPLPKKTAIGRRDCKEARPKMEKNRKNGDWQTALYFSIRGIGDGTGCLKGKEPKEKTDGGKTQAEGRAWRKRNTVANSRHGPIKKRQEGMYLTKDSGAPLYRFLAALPRKATKEGVPIKNQTRKKLETTRRPSKNHAQEGEFHRNRVVSLNQMK